MSMSDNYEVTDPNDEDCDWKKYDTADYGAVADYYDQVAQEQAPMSETRVTYTGHTPEYTPTPTMLEEAMRAMTHAELLRKRAKLADSSIFKTQAEEAMTWAVAYGQLAQAESLARIAAALETGNHAAWGIRRRTPNEE